MRPLRWARVREASAVASSPELVRPGNGPGPGDGDADDQTCTTCDGTGINGGDLCSSCDGSGSTMKESTSGEYWVYMDDPEFEKLQEASRTFSPDVRKKFSSSGVAMSDGSYPIPDADALSRAVKSFGRNATATVKAHIVKRAKSLGLTKNLPDDWNVSSSKESDNQDLNARIDALEQEMQHSQQLWKSLRESKPASMTPAFSQPTRVKTKSGQEGYEVTLIREGKGNAEDDQWYSADSIRELCESGVAEGMQAFSNHPTEDEEEDRPERDVKELVGTYHDVKFAESGGKARAEAIFVPLTYDENHPRYGWVVTLAEAAVRSNSQQPICGISLYGLSAGDDVERPDGTFGRMVSLVRPQSGDIVTNAGAGGGFIRQLMESARALRNKSTKELTPMKSMAYQSAVREASKRVREAQSDEDRTEALKALEALEGEKIDNVPDSIEQLREAAPALVEKIRESVKSEVKEADGDKDEQINQLKDQLRESQGNLSKITDAIGITEALREAGVEDSIELRHYAGIAQDRKLTDVADIKEMVEVDKALVKKRNDDSITAMREALGGDFDSDVEGVIARIPTASLPTDDGDSVLSEVGIPTMDAE